jgi:hypothetical protein
MWLSGFVCLLASGWLEAGPESQCNLNARLEWETLKNWGVRKYVATRAREVCLWQTGNPNSRTCWAQWLLSKKRFAAFKVVNTSCESNFRNTRLREIFTDRNYVLERKFSR